MTSSWDVFHSVRLEVERGISTEAVRDKLGAGALNGDDLIRPAGTTRWNRISQVAAFNEPATPIEPPAPTPTPPSPAPTRPTLAEVPPPLRPPAPAPTPPPTRAEAPPALPSLRAVPTPSPAPPPARPVPLPPVEAVAPPPPPAPVEPLRLRPVPEPAPEVKPEPEPVPDPEPAPAPLAELEFPDDEPELEFFPEENEDDSIEAEVVNLDDSIEAETVNLDDSVEAEVVPAPTPAAAFVAPTPDDDDPFADDEAEFEPPVLPDDEAGGPRPPELADPLAPELETENDAEDDPAADFSLSRRATERVEELDLAAMVDVAFQLVLFFLVTASTVVFKTLEVPKPNEDKPPEAAAQSRAKSIDELEKDYILVEVDAEGAVKVDHLPVNADRAALVEKLRQARESTGRKAMLLSADFNTRHRNAVLAFDVASEIDLQIAIAQPTGKN